ncbi:hypothetical protein ACHAQH_006311 [Verticillium albo-atrum]
MAEYTSVPQPSSPPSDLPYRVQRSDTDVSFAALTGQKRELLAYSKPVSDDSRPPDYKHRESRPAGPHRYYSLPVPTNSNYQNDKGFNYKRRRFYHKYWVSESFALLCAIGCFIFYICIIFINDGQPVEGWQHRHIQGITKVFKNLPSFVAFISTIMRGLIGYPIAAAMGQLKWHYFRKGQLLEEIESIDKGSRGVSGAIKLIFSKGLFRLVTVGAFLLLSTIFMGPFFQNAIDQKIRAVRYTTEQALEISLAIQESDDDPDFELKLDGIMPVANYYNAYITPDDEKSPDLAEAATEMVATIKMGWFHSVVSDDIQGTAVPTECSTGRCFWHDVVTLGVLSKCVVAEVEQLYDEDDNQYGESRQANISSLRIFDDMTIRTDLQMRASFTIPDASSFKDNSSRLPLFAHVAAIGQKGGEDFEAAECVLFWAGLDEESVSMMSDGYVEMSVGDGYDQSAKDVTFGQEDDIFLDTPELWKFNTSSSDKAEWSPCELGVNWIAHRGLQNFFEKFFNGYSYYALVTNSTNAAYIVSNAEIDALWWSNNRKETDDDGKESSRPGLASALGKHMDNVAEFMSNHIRTNTLTWIGKNNSRAYVYGTIEHDDIFFRMNKNYAAYPGCMLALTIIFYLTTIWRTRREPAWKNSQLALIYHGLVGGENGSPSEDMDSIASMEGLAEKIETILEWRHDSIGWRLKAVDGETAPLMSERVRDDYVSATASQV